MIFDGRVSCGNMKKHFDFIQCFYVSVSSRNMGWLRHCFFIVFPCFKCFPLKGTADAEHVTSPFGVGRCV